MLIKKFVFLLMVGGVLVSLHSLAQTVAPVKGTGLQTPSKTQPSVQVDPTQSDPATKTGTIGKADSGSPAADPIATVDLNFYLPPTTAAFNHLFKFGVPFGLSEKISVANKLYATIEAPDGKTYPADVEVASTYHWADGSLRWAIFKSHIPVPASETDQMLSGKLKIYDAQPLSETNEFEVNDEAGAVRIVSGKIRVFISRTRGTIIDRLDYDKNGDGHFSADENLFKAKTDLKTEDAASVKKFGSYWVGRRRSTQSVDALYSTAMIAPESVAVEYNDEQSVVVRLEGWYANREDVSETSGRYVARVMISQEDMIRLQFTHIFTENTAKYFIKEGLGTISNCHGLYPDSYETDCLVEQPRDFVLKDLAVSFPIALEGNMDFALEDGTDESSKISQIEYKLTQNSVTTYLSNGTEKSGKMAGSLAALTGATPVALGAANFWKLFPGALSATSGNLKYYFWTPTPAKHDLKNPTIENFYHNYFAHEGPELDFRVPDKMGEILQKYEGSFTDTYPQMASAYGLGITADLVLALGDAAGERARLSVAENAPLIQPDPQQSADSGVYGDLSVKTKAAAKTSFPSHDFTTNVEHFLDQIIEKWDTVQTLIDPDSGYGRFDFTDFHTKMLHDTTDPSTVIDWSPYRSRPQFHHGVPRVFGILSARTSERQPYRIFIDQIRHLVDGGIGHMSYSADNGYVPEGSSTGPYETKAMKGAMGDYKHLVPWGFYSRGSVFEYNTVLDAQLWAYYRSGDLRIRDVLREQFDLFFLSLTNETTYADSNDRSAEGALKALLDVYEAIDTQADVPWADAETDRTRQSTTLQIIRNSYSTTTSADGKTTTTGYLERMIDTYDKICKNYHQLGYANNYVPDGYISHNTYADDAGGEVDGDVIATHNWVEYLAHAVRLSEEQMNHEVFSAEDLANLKTVIVSLADNDMDQRPISATTPINYYTLAYKLTGDPKYLEYAVKKYDAEARAVFPESDTFFSYFWDRYEATIEASKAGGTKYAGQMPETHALTKSQWVDKASQIYEGLPAKMEYTFDWSWLAQRLPSLLALSQKAGVDISQLEETVIPFRFTSGNDTDAPSYYKAHLRVEEGETAEVHLSCFTGMNGAYPNGPPTVTLTTKATGKVETLKWETSESVDEDYNENMWPEYPLVKSLTQSGDYLLEVRADGHKVMCYLPMTTATGEVYETCLSDLCSETFGVTNGAALYFNWDGTNSDTEYGDLRMSTAINPNVITLTSPSGQFTQFPGLFYTPTYYPTNTTNRVWDSLQGKSYEEGLWRFEPGVHLDGDGNSSFTIRLRKIGYEGKDGTVFSVSRGRFFEPEM